MELDGAELKLKLVELGFWSVEMTTSVEEVKWSAKIDAVDGVVECKKSDQSAASVKAWLITTVIRERERDGGGGEEEKVESLDFMENDETILAVDISGTRRRGLWDLTRENHVGRIEKRFWACWLLLLESFKFWSIF